MDAQPNDFRYFLTVDSIRTEIVFSPNGWEKNSRVSYKRDTKYFGVMRSWGLPLEFVLDGARILRSAYYQYGIESGVRIEVEELNRATFEYELSFVGDIDFSEFNDEQDVVSVMLMQSGITRNLKAYSNVKYEHDLIGDDVVNIILPGVVFTEKSDSIFIPGSSLSTRYIPELDLIINNTNSGFGTVQNVSKQEIDDNGFASSPNWFFRSEKVNLSVFVTGKIKGSAASTGNNTLQFLIKNQDNVTVATLYTINFSGVTTFDFSFERLFVLNSQERIYVYARMSNESGGVFPPGSIINEGDLSVSYTSVSNPSSCKGIKAFDLYKRILRRISSGTTPTSFLLNNTWKNLIFTSGDGIRELPNAKIKISFDEFFDTINGIDDAAVGIENDELRIEAGSYFARNVQSVNVGLVKNCVISPAKSYMFNSIKVGYNDGNTDETNGKEEYNSGQIWQMPITRVQSEKSWISPTRADQFGIENLRVNFVTKASTDNSSDNDTFMIECYPDGTDYRPILGSSYQSVTGLTSPNTAYNLNLSPKKNLLRHGSFLHSILDNMEGRYINFGSGDKNTSLRTVKDSVIVAENENILVSSLPSKYFLPVTVKITCKLPKGSRRLFDTNPFGYVTFEYKKSTFKGFILDCSVDIARNTEQEFELLLTSDNNLLNLI